MQTRGIRGATTLQNNTKEEIKTATVELLSNIIKDNNIKLQDIAFVIFTVTNDINADFPAKYARQELHFDSVPMMCYREMEVIGQMPLCLRVLVVVNTDKTQSEIMHCYLKGAKALRKDLYTTNE